MASPMGEEFGKFVNLKHNVELIPKKQSLKAKV